MDISIGKPAEENKYALSPDALSMDIVEKYLFGNHKDTLVDPEETIWVGQNQNGRLAC